MFLALLLVVATSFTLDGEVSLPATLQVGWPPPWAPDATSLLPAGQDYEFELESAVQRSSGHGATIATLVSP